MAYDFTLTAIIPASPQQIYDAWTDSLGHTEMTGSKANMSNEIGADVSAWDNYITGRNLELVPGQRIVQSWRTTEFFDEDEDSLVTVTLEDADGDTLLTLVHTNVPLGLTIYEQGGWQACYFDPMQKYFAQSGPATVGRKAEVATPKSKRWMSNQPAFLPTSIASRVRSLGTKALHFGRFHPAINSLRVRTEQRRFITCFGKGDGAGAQALAIMSTMLFAHDTGLVYVHTPFKRIQHNPNGDPKWEAKWEKFFNLGEGEILREQLTKPWIERVRISKLIELPYSGDNVLYVVKHCHEYANYFPYRYQAISDRFAEKYYSSAKNELPCHYDRSRLNIAVHVRRDDVVQQGPTANRYSTNEFVASVLRQIIDVALNTTLPVSVRLYSEGQVADFGELGDMDIEFHLNECPFSTLNNLVRADVLLMSKSAFSYVAALLSRGVKVFEPFDPTSFVHRPLPHWIVAHQDGTLSQRLLGHALDNHLSAHRSSSLKSDRLV